MRHVFSLRTWPALLLLLLATLATLLTPVTSVFSITLNAGAAARAGTAVDVAFKLDTTLAGGVYEGDLFLKSMNDDPIFVQGTLRHCRSETVNASVGIAATAYAAAINANTFSFNTTNAMTNLVVRCRITLSFLYANSTNVAVLAERVNGVSQGNSTTNLFLVGSPAIVFPDGAFLWYNDAWINQGTRFNMRFSFTGSLRSAITELGAMRINLQIEAGTTHTFAAIMSCTLDMGATNGGVIQLAAPTLSGANTIANFAMPALQEDTHDGQAITLNCLAPWRSDTETSVVASFIINPSLYFGVYQFTASSQPTMLPMFANTDSFSALFAIAETAPTWNSVDQVRFRSSVLSKRLESRHFQRVDESTVFIQPLHTSFQLLACHDVCLLILIFIFSSYFHNFSLLIRTTPGLARQLRHHQAGP